MDSTPPSLVTQNTGSNKQPKLRATCDACKDAKTRCNRELPTCYRCRNQKLKCVYNLSRRMGRPRRIKTGTEADGTGCENKQDKDQRMSQAEDRNTHLEGNTVELQGQENQHTAIDYANYSSISTNTGSNNAKTQDADGLSPFIDGFHSPESYDLTQLQHTVDLTDFDQMADFDYSHGPVLAVTPLPTTPDMSQISQHLQPQSNFIFETPLMKEKSNREEVTNPTLKASSISDSSVNSALHGDLSLVDGLNRKSTSTLDSAFDLHHMQTCPNNGKDNCNHGHSRLFNEPDGNVPAFSQSFSCGCYESILQKLSDLDESQTDLCRTTIDVALMLESGVQVHIIQVLQCGTCASKRPTLLLLLAIIIDNVVCMLENASSSSIDKSQSENDITSRNRPAQTSTRTRNGSTSPTETLRLVVGSHEILSEEKDRFLKQLLQARLSSLSTTLRRLMQYMQKSPPNSNSRRGSMMVAETYKRLQSIIGRVELWDG